MISPVAHTVILMGAGASKALFGLPVMADFFISYPPSSYPNLSRFLTQYFHSATDSMLPAYNLEEVVTALELRLDRVGQFGLEKHDFIQEARREFDVFVYETLQSRSVTLRALHILELIDFPTETFANDPNCAVSLLTLNYDLGMEHVLFNVTRKNDLGKIEHGTVLDRVYSLLGRTQLMHGDRPSLFWQHREASVFLKLHGSVDWLYCPFPDCGNHQLFFPNWIDTPEVHDQPGQPCALCGTPLQRVIVPPSLLKSFDRYPKLGLLWNLAHREIARAKRLVLFGLSFPPSDYYLRWLLRSGVAHANEQGIHPSIEIVNITDDSTSTIRQLTGVQPRFRDDLVCELQQPS